MRRINSFSSKVTNKELADGEKDEYGVVYSYDWKKVLSCNYLHCKCYQIRKGARIIADGAFSNQNIGKLVIPSSVIKIGENPFTRDSFYNAKKIRIENHSPSFIVKGCALYSKDMSIMISYWGNDKHFVVPSDVKHIASGCFANSNYLENIVFPTGLESIGREAFVDCYSLHSIDLPKSVKSIGASAFWGCEHLENVWSLGAIVTIEPNTFEGCNLKFIHLPSSLERIADDAFNWNIELGSIELPDSIEELGNSCFAYCKKLERVNLGESLRSIGNFCFYGCSIKEVRLPSSLISLGILPFIGVENIITKPNALFKSKSGMLIHTKLKKLECYFGNDTTLILKDIKSISPFAFYKSSVENIVISDSVKVISEYAFYSASKMRSISLPNQLELIETGAFCGCSNLENLIIPETVEEIRSSSVSGCLSLKSIQFKGAKTKVSEAIMNYKCYDGFPTAYHSHDLTIGSYITEVVTSHCEVEVDADADAFKVITIIVPHSSKANFKFNPVFSTMGGSPMHRRFHVIEVDEGC